MNDQKKKVEQLMKKGENKPNNNVRSGLPSAMARVKNKMPAPVQITAEQLLREAQERQEQDSKPPRQKITDPDELADYRYSMPCPLPLNSPNQPYR